MRAKIPQLREALARRFEIEHHGVLVAQLLAHIDTLDAAIQNLNERIDLVLTPHAQIVELFAALETVGAAVELGLGEHGLDHALAFGVEPAAVLVFTALRPPELVARDVDGGRLSARQGVVVVRSGTGDAFREVASMPEVRAR